MARTLLLMLAVTLLGLGCAEQPTKEIVGTGAGAAIGGIIGSEVGDGTTGTVIGGVVGALIGRKVSRRMDAQDRENARTAFEENRTVNWDNPDTNTEYTVRPTETFERDGRTWLRSGDVGCLDADGYVFIVDRLTRTEPTDPLALIRQVTSTRPRRSGWR